MSATAADARPAAIDLYDSARRAVVPFEPLAAGQVGVYDCGPTVWDYQHIGNLYRYIVSDVVRRTFELLGYRVRQVMNITDVGAIVGDVDEGEDRMAKAVRREGKDVLELAEEYTRVFFEDRRRLHVLDPHVVSKATGHIPEMLALIETLIAKGHAYVAPDGVYFDIATFPGYGTRLNAEAPADRMAGARIEVNPNKRNPADFALWRSAKPDDVQRWASPWGEGKPGWHIECSAMSMKYLGETFDIHSGGEDHLFPHHECEIAQSEAATGKPFVRYWQHVRFLTVDGQGMHKSIGNTYRLKDLEAWGFDPLAFRLQVLGVSYRKGMDFTRHGLEAAQNRLDRWRRAIGGALGAGMPATVASDHPALVAFRAALADDFNTPQALAIAEPQMDVLGSDDPAIRAEALGVLFEMDRVLALGLAAIRQTELTSEEKALLDERAAARAKGDYKRSDEIRSELERRGLRVKDTKDGQRWERIPPRGSDAT